MTPLLRPANSDDAPAITTILITSRLAFLPFAPSPHSAQAMHTWVAETLLPSASVTVAEIDGKVVGVLAVSRDAVANWIDQLYLAPDYVAQGIGSLLLAHALHTLARPIRLYTFQQNLPARRFYERHGFVAIEMTDGSSNEEQCPDVLYQLSDELLAF